MLSRLGVLVGGLLSTGSVWAQTVGLGPQISPPSNSVEEAGVMWRALNFVPPRVGSFFFYPYVSTTLLYNDNLFSARTNKESDLVWTKEAGVAMVSDWGRHMLSAAVNVVNTTHRANPNDNYTNFRSRLNGRIDVMRDLNIGIALGAARSQESRGSTDSPTSAAEPTVVHTYDGFVSLNKRFNRLTVQVGGGVTYLDYFDVSAVGGGTIDQDNRDGLLYSAIFRSAYEFSPGYRTFVATALNKRDFRGRAGLPSRDSWGYETRAGLEAEITNLMTGSISVGYMTQDYADPTMADASGLALMGNLLWNPTRLMTVSLGVARRVSDTTVSNASSHVDTTVTARIDYEILRNLVGSPTASYIHEDYQGISRVDQTWQLGVALTFVLNRSINTQAFYRFTKKVSTDSSVAYEKNEVGGTVTLRF